VPNQVDAQTEQHVDAHNPDRRVGRLGVNQYRQVLRDVWGHAADDQRRPDKRGACQRKHRDDMAGCERHPLIPGPGDSGSKPATRRPFEIHAQHPPARHGHQALRACPPRAHEHPGSQVFPHAFDSSPRSLVMVAQADQATAGSCPLRIVIGSSTRARSFVVARSNTENGTRSLHTQPGS